MNNFRDESYIKEKGIDFPLPSHVGIIMDGNGRWAKARALPRNAGHKEGVNRLRSIVRVAAKLGIDSLSVYAFSTENWKRSQEEVAGLMKLLVDTFANLIDELAEGNIRICHMGELDGLSPKVKDTLEKAVEITKNNTGLTFNIGFNYGGRCEITNAVRRIAQQVEQGDLAVSDITEQLISDNLYTHGQTDPDVIIRTSGELRISNFMLYQIAYSELIAVDDFWPDFSDDRFIETLREFSTRDRRFGNAK